MTDTLNKQDTRATLYDELTKGVSQAIGTVNTAASYNDAVTQDDNLSGALWTIDDTLKDVRASLDKLSALSAQTPIVD